MAKSSCSFLAASSFQPCLTPFSSMSSAADFVHWFVYGHVWLWRNLSENGRERKKREKNRFKINRFFFLILFETYFNFLFYFILFIDHHLPINIVSAPWITGVKRSKKDTKYCWAKDWALACRGVVGPNSTRTGLFYIWCMFLCPLGPKPSI